MRAQFLKDLILFDGRKIYYFKHYRHYNLPLWIAEALISQGYCFQYSYMSELPLTMNEGLVKSLEALN